MSDPAESEPRSRELNQAQPATPPGDGLETGDSTGLRVLPARAKTAARKSRARVEARRESVPLIGASFDVVERDSGIGGGILAGALAYRLSFFLLPLGLVAVGALGIVTAGTGRSAESLGEATGMSALVTASVANAIEDEASWYALLVGVPILVWVSSGKEDIDGVLGIAAALPFSLYLGGRLIVATAVLDATLWERRRAAVSASAEEGEQQ